MVVDLPAPLGPRSPKISPGSTRSDRLSRATISKSFFCFEPGPREPIMLNPATPAAIGGGDEYTLRKSFVRTPIAMLHLAIWPGYK